MLRLWQRDCVATARHLGKGSPSASAQARSCIRVVDLPVQSVADVMLADSPACSEGRAENAGDIRACKADIRELAIGHHRHLLHDCAPVPSLGEFGQKSARPSEAPADSSRDVDG